jgi:hypothetical protein
MNRVRACLFERGTRVAPRSGQLGAVVMREPGQGRGLVSPRILPLGIGQQRHDRYRYDGLLVELLLRLPDMSTRQLCRLLSMQGCPCSSTTVGRTRQRLKMCMATGLSKRRSCSGRLEDCDDAHLAAAALDSRNEGQR